MGWIKIGTLLSLVATFALGSDFKTYELNHFSDDTGQCEKDINDHGIRLEKMGIHIHQTYCAPEKFGSLLKGVIIYRGTQKLPVVSTDDTGHFASRAAYSSKQECESALSGERALFERMTLVKPFISYCYPEPIKEELAYGLRIDGLGNPQVRPFVSSVSLYLGKTVGDKASLVSALRKRLKLHDVTVNTVVIRNTNASDYLVTRYYAKRKIDVKSTSVARLMAANDCEDQALALDKALGSVSSSYLGVLCTKNDFPWKTDLNLITVGRSDVSKFEPLDRYPTLEKCEINRERVLEFYRADLKKPIWTAICTREDGVYGYVMFLPKN